MASLSDLNLFIQTSKNPTKKDMIKILFGAFSSDVPSHPGHTLV